MGTRSATRDDLEFTPEPLGDEPERATVAPQGGPRGPAGMAEEMSVDRQAERKLEVEVHGWGPPDLIV